jgi:hypothetical protein
MATSESGAAREVLDRIETARKSLAAELDAGDWTAARISQRHLSDALDDLSKHIGAAESAEDVDRHNELVSVYNAALMTWNEAVPRILNGLEAAQ